MEQQGEIILYQPDESVRMEVRIEDETVWLTQAQIVELFQSSKANISEHLKNIYKSEELIQSSTVRNFRTVDSADNSSESYIFLICSLILALLDWNKLTICACVNQTVSFSIRTSSFIVLSGWYSIISPCSILVFAIFFKIIFS